MESGPAVSTQRSPWVYVLLGCLGFAALSCLGVFGACGFLYKKGSDLQKGVTDPKTREENARRSLGGIPDGYFVAMSISFGGFMETTALTNAPPLADGGVEQGDRVFVFVHRSSEAEHGRRAREYWTKDGTDTLALRESGVNLVANEVLKRGQLRVGGRSVRFVASRGSLDTMGGGREAPAALDMAVLFDCSPDALDVGVWEMKDPDPAKAASAVDLTGTVADEAALAKFLTPIDPCRK